MFSDTSSEKKLFSDLISFETSIFRLRPIASIFCLQLHWIPRIMRHVFNPEEDTGREQPRLLSTGITIRNSCSCFHDSCLMQVFALNSSIVIALCASKESPGFLSRASFSRFATMLVTSQGFGSYRTSLKGRGSTTSYSTQNPFDQFA